MWGGGGGGDAAPNLALNLFLVTRKHRLSCLKEMLK